MEYNQPNPPVWGDNVLIFSPDDAIDTINEKIFNTTSHLQKKEGHFSDSRIAILFKPGTYNVDVLVGYYTQVLGLGAKVNDTVFISEKGVYCNCMDPGAAGSLDTFWRSAENFTTNNMLYAVSQATPLRRIHIKNNLLLHDKGEYASGGFMANIKIDNNCYLGSQQQWMSRNCEFNNNPTGGAWNVVYVGCSGVPQSTKRSSEPVQNLSINTIDETPIIAEKPFITVEKDEISLESKFYLQIPKIKRNTKEVEHEINELNCDTVDFSNVYVTNNTDTSESIQKFINLGYNILFTPNIYKISKTLEIKKNKQVLLGIGMATLLAPLDGTPIIFVPDYLEDIRIGGLMLEASNIGNLFDGSCLLKWGDDYIYMNTSENKAKHIRGFMYDIFCRVGGSSIDKDISIDKMVIINSDNVVIDSLWVWRSDHSKLDSENGEEPEEGEKYHLVKLNEFKCNNALIVNGDFITIYNLACEHTLQDQLIYNGEYGEVYFYQSELPYDVDLDYQKKKYVGYRVTENVKNHLLVAGGVYCFFRDHDVFVDNAFSSSSLLLSETPLKNGINFINPYTVFLNGNGGIKSVLNGIGDEVSKNTKMLAFL